MTIGHGARAWAAYPALSAPLTMMGVERRWFLLSATLGMAMWNAVNSIMIGAEEHLELLRCHYNFVRPHGALKFGREVRTPAMQAGLATRRLTFREIFMGQPPSLLILT